MNKQIRILLVDDEKDFLESMALWFDSKGYSVTSVFNGEDALRVIKANTPDIVFLDLVMPKMDGISVLQSIRKFNKNLPVILMSAYVEESRDEKKDHFYGVSRIFYKDDGLPKALTLLELTLRIKK